MKVTRDLRVVIELTEDEALKLSRVLKKMRVAAASSMDRMKLVNDGSVDTMLGFQIAIDNALDLE